MMDTGEPLFDTDADERGTSDPAAGTLIDALVTTQDYAVLCVQGEGQPYGALIAYAFSPDLRHAIFVTPVTTRKYRLLSECDHVALVIDDRPDKAGRLMEVQAVTATGRSRQIARGADFDRWAELLVARHPYLKAFVHAETCALFCVDIVRFFYVERFQEVRQWIPTAHS